MKKDCDCTHAWRSKNLNDMKTVLLHEYRHYIHFSYGYVGKTNGTCFYLYSAVTEGFSAAAEHLLIDYLLPLASNNETAEG